MNYLPMNTKFINVLIDYDNLMIDSTENTKSTIDYIIQRIFTSCTELGNCDKYSISIRLYGGWYSESNLTRKAQELTSHLQKEFPTYNDKLKSTVSVELSRSLAIRPNIDLLCTYREKERLGRIFICRDDQICCSQAKASIHFLKKLKRNGKCPHCLTGSSNLVWVAEQKLVDVMLAMDITYFSDNEEDATLVIVSSDDDFIPAIFQANYRGKKIYHMHAKPNCQTRQVYKSIAHLKNYMEMAF